MSAKTSLWLISWESKGLKIKVMNLRQKEEEETMHWGTWESGILLHSRLKSHTYFFMSWEFSSKWIVQTPSLKIRNEIWEVGGGESILIAAVLREIIKFSMDIDLFNLRKPFQQTPPIGGERPLPQSLLGKRPALSGSLASLPTKGTGTFTSNEDIRIMWCLDLLNKFCDLFIF